MAHNLVTGLVIFMVLAIMSSLVVALYNLLVSQGQGRNSSAATVRALTFRIALSIGLFLSLFIAFYYGYITPHGIFS